MLKIIITFQALDILDQEASEDEEMRAAYEGDIWTRPTSYDANTHLTDAARRYRDTLDNIDNTSRELRGTWDIWSKNIEPLCWTTVSNIVYGILMDIYFMRHVGRIGTCCA